MNIPSAFNQADGQPVLYKYARVGNLAYLYKTDKTTKHKYFLGEYYERFNSKL